MCGCVVREWSSCVWGEDEKYSLCMLEACV